MIFSKEKEYFIGILPRHCLYVICTKIVKDKSGNVESISFKSLDSDQTLTYTIEEVNNFVMLFNLLIMLNSLLCMSIGITFIKKVLIKI